MPEQDRQPVQITTRVEPDLADRLIAIAGAERRSLSNLLALAVEKFVHNYEANLTQGG